MANTYTPNFRYRMPAIGDELWADEFYQNQEIKDAVTKNHTIGARVSGLLVALNSGLSISWEAGRVLISGITHTINSGSMVLPPAGNVNILVPVYIYTDGNNVVASTVVPPLMDGTLLAIADTSIQQIAALVDTRVVGELLEQNDTFYIDPNGNDNASGSVTEPWRTIPGALNNIRSKNFTLDIDEITLTILSDIVITEEVSIIALNHTLRITGTANRNSITFTGTITNGFLLSDLSNKIIFEYLTLTGEDTTNMFLVINSTNVRLSFIDIHFSSTGLNCSKSKINLNSISLFNLLSFPLNPRDSSTVYAENMALTGCVQPILIQTMASLQLSNIEFNNHESSLFTLYSNSKLLVESIAGTSISSLDYLFNAHERSSIKASFCDFSGFNSTSTAIAASGTYIYLGPGNTGVGSLYPAANTVGNDNSYIKEI